MSWDWEVVADVASAVCFLGGALLALAAGVGVLRFPDLLSRMHAGTKPQVLGLVLVLIGLSLRLRSGGAVWALVLVALFQMLTAPVAAHLVGRAGYRTGKVRQDLLVVDELTEAQELAGRAATRRAAAAADEPGAGDAGSTTPGDLPPGDPQPGGPGPGGPGPADRG